MFFLDWWYNAMARLGLFHKNVNVVFLGLDNTGKTMLIHALQNDDDEKNTSLADLRIPPTLHPCKKEFMIHDKKCTIFDLGTYNTPARRLWPDYFEMTDAIVYLVDASNKSRFAEAKKELDALLTCEELRTRGGVPFLILGNKIDLPTAVSEEELREALDLVDTATTAAATTTITDEVSYFSIYNNDKDEQFKLKIELYMCSVIRKMGYSEGFRWLFLQRFRHNVASGEGSRGKN